MGFFFSNKMINRGPLLLPSPTFRMQIKKEKEEDEEKPVPIVLPSTVEEILRLCLCSDVPIIHALAA